VEPDTELKEDREKKALKENPQREQALERLERAATAWSVWEGITSFLAPGDNWKDFEEPQFAKEFARIENHYFMHGGFLDGSGKRDNNYLLDSVHKIAHLPVYIVQGQFDQICPRCEADELVAALGVKAKVEYVLTAAGHSATERENVKALTEIMDNL
jgi:proline iminopeptidase